MLKKITLLFTIFVLISACGGSDNNNSPRVEDSTPNETVTPDETIMPGDTVTPDQSVIPASNIPYLRSNHSEYFAADTVSNPVPINSLDSLTVEWLITSDNNENARKLYEHIEFMKQRLEGGATPRAWDKLFLLEAYMKSSHRYSTTVKQERNNSVSVIKTATDRCAFETITAHANAVSEDFFASGDISKDYSAIAESIIDSSYCSTSKSDIESYISARIQSR